MNSRFTRLTCASIFTGFLLVSPTLAAPQLIGLVPTTKPFQPAKSQAPVDIKELNSELIALKEDLNRTRNEFLSPTAEIPLPNPKRMKFTEYQAAYSQWAERVRGFSDRLEKCYSQLNWIYQNRPTEKAYAQIHQAYSTCDGTYGELLEGFKKLNVPHSLQVQMVVVKDQRLNEHVGRNVGNSRGELTAEQLDQADQVTFLGSFDVVNLILVVNQDQAFYVLHWWRETSGGSDVIHNDVVFTPAFPKSQIQDFALIQHMEYALSLKLTPVQTDGNQFLDLINCLDRLTTYMKAE